MKKGVVLDDLFSHSGHWNCLSRAQHIERFWLKTKTASNGCIEWCAGLTKKGGYGAFCVNQRDMRAHVFSYAIANGGVPPGVCVLHKCDNRRCVNPNHLFLGSESDNSMDMMLKARQKGGPRRHPDHVRQFVVMSWNNHKNINKVFEIAGSLYGVPKSYVVYIAKYQRNHDRAMIEIVKNDCQIPKSMVPRKWVWDAKNTVDRLLEYGMICMEGSRLWQNKLELQREGML
jgi:hypothetical protein